MMWKQSYLKSDRDESRSSLENNAENTGNGSVSEAVAPIAELRINGRFNGMSKGGLTDEATQSSSSPPAISATSMASSVFSNVSYPRCTEKDLR